jgi:hypothetical protein
MPVKWSPLRVIESIDIIEEYVGQAVEPLEQARVVAREARDIPNLPQYVDQYLLRIISEIDRSIGGSQWEPEGRLKTAIESVRKSIPESAIETEKKRLKHGNQLSLTY